MRSTAFVIVSIMMHATAIAVVALSPQRISEFKNGASVEVLIGQPDTQPGIAEAPKVIDAPPATKNDEPKEEPVVQHRKKPVAAKVKTVASQKLPPKQTPPEKLDPAIEEAVVVPAPAPVSAADESSDDKLIPVKDSAPAGVEAATDQETEATSQDIQKTEDPAPVGVSEATPTAAASPELGKGGATQEGAVDFHDLKQGAGNVPPIYPLAARREKRQGEVELLYRVTKEGRVTDVSIAKSSGSADLDNEAVRAVGKYHFVPGQEGWAKHPVQFSLKGDTAALPSRLRTKVGAQE